MGCVYLTVRGGVVGVSGEWVTVPASLGAEIDRAVLGGRDSNVTIALIIGGRRIKRSIIPLQRPD